MKSGAQGPALQGSARLAWNVEIRPAVIQVHRSSGLLLPFVLSLSKGGRQYMGLIHEERGTRPRATGISAARLECGDQAGGHPGTPFFWPSLAVRPEPVEGWAAIVDLAHQERGTRPRATGISAARLECGDQAGGHPGTPFFWPSPAVRPEPVEGWAAIVDLAHQERGTRPRATGISAARLECGDQAGGHPGTPFFWPSPAVRPEPVEGWAAIVDLAHQERGTRPRATGISGNHWECRDQAGGHPDR